MGYGQTDAYNDAVRRLDNTKAVQNRDPFFPEGTFEEVMVIDFQPFMHDTHGPSARCTFEVIKSNVAPPGARFCKMWFLVKPSKFVSQTNDSDRFADFIRQLSGRAATGPTAPVGDICSAVLRDRVSENLLVGMVIKARGVNTSKKVDKPFVEVFWENIAQTQDAIKHRRMQIERGGQPAQQGAVQAPAPAQYEAPPQPAPTQWQQPAQPQQYAPAAAPAVQWQGAPQQPAPAQWQQPVQPAGAPAAAAPQSLLSQIPGFGAPK